MYIKNPFSENEVIHLDMGKDFGTPLSYHKDTKTLVFEISDLRVKMYSLPDRVVLLNPKTGRSKEFVFTSEDRRDGEAVGWNFTAVDKSCNLLAIND